MAKGARPKPEQDKKTGRFVAGNSGSGGRPKGSRNKLGEAFLADMLEDWEENGKTAIATVRAEKPDAYLKVVASILPKELNVNVNELEELSQDELDERIAGLAAALAQYENPDRHGAGGEAAQAEADGPEPLSPLQ